MKRFFIALSIFVLIIVLFYTCKSRSGVSSQKYEVELIANEKIDHFGGELLLKISTNGVWRIDKPTTDDWYSVSSNAGKGTNTVILKILANDNGERVGKFSVFFDTEKEIVEFTQRAFDEAVVVGETVDKDPINQEHHFNPTGEASRIEMPRLSKDFVEDKAAFVVHYAEDNVGDRTLNYSMEYNYASHHSRWVAFTFYDKTAERHTKRTNAWSIDPYLLDYSDNAYDFRGSGYDRGHLVASADRLYSIPANEQTFYYSNMSPQVHSFNGGIWASLENKVQAWGALSAIRDTLYVAKGGTIAPLQVMGTIGDNKIVIPTYYFMALLAKKGSTYKSIAFWFEHRAHPQPYSLQDYALSVEELEKLTGIDFFHNLPDDIERIVEKQNNPFDWPDL